VKRYLTGADFLSTFIQPGTAIRDKGKVRSEKLEGNMYKGRIKSV
jgi:hypothetical protein